MSDLGETLAGLLGGLDDHEMRLLSRQTELTEELRSVEEELGRITAVREAALGKPKAKPKAKRASGASGYTPSAETIERRERILAFLNGDPQKGGDIAEHLGVNAQGVGPILAGMVRAGSIDRLEDGRYERRG